MKQFDAKVGDNIRLGNLTTPIIGELKKVPGESVALATVAPRVYIAMSDLGEDRFVAAGQPGELHTSISNFCRRVNVSNIVERIKPELDKLRLSHHTVDDSKRDLGRSMENLYHFLNLVGFIALLLGGVGVASAIHVHVKQKLGTVALLRCLGCSVGQTFAILPRARHGAGIILGALIGAALGVVIQFALPGVLADLIPFDFQFATSWWAVGRAVLVGFVICLLFALLPLLAVRRVSPLAAIRASFESAARRRDPLRWLVGALLGLGIAIFALAQSRDWRVGLGFTVGLGVVFGILAGTAATLIFLTKKLALPNFPVCMAAGHCEFASSRTTARCCCCSRWGWELFLMVSLYLVQQTLLTQLITSGGTNQANTILFDIQPDQREGVMKLVSSFNFPILDEAPIVTMRLTSVKGRTVEAMLGDKENKIPHWSLRHEYRSTFSDHLRDGEKVTAGEWEPQVIPGTNVTPVSVEAGLAKELQNRFG